MQHLDAFDFGGTQSVVGGSLTFPIIDVSDDGSEETRPGECAGGLPFYDCSLTIHFIHPCRFIGLRFAGITLPQGASITSAFIDLTRQGNSTGPVITTIVGQAIDDAAPLTGFNTNTPDISSRTPTNAAVDWDVQNFSGGNPFSSPDIKTIVQEIVDRPGWASGQAMFFRFQDGAGSAFNNSKRGSSGPRFRRFRVT